MESKELTQMYVSNPEQNKETLTSYTSYTLQGVRVPEPLTRRYRDFASLRDKIIERWPGIYIPALPHKQVVGSNDKEVVDMRIEMINRFCEQLSQIGCIFNSEEVETFIQNSNDIQKTLAAIQPHTYEELLKKYSASFLDYDENFDTLAGKSKQTKFLAALKNILPRLKAFFQVVKNCRDKYTPIHNDANTIFHLLEVYESDTLKEYTKKDDKEDEGKLVLVNQTKQDIQTGLTQVKESLINPYNKLLDNINGDILDTEAMIEALQSLNSLQDSYDNITKNCTSTTMQLNELQAGKSNFKSMFSFKSRDQTITQLSEEKEKLEKDLNNLGQVIKIATHNMDTEMRRFKNANLDNYYAELALLQKGLQDNCKKTQQLWDSLLNEENIMKAKI